MKIINEYFIAVCIIAYLGIYYALTGNVDAALMAVVVLIVAFIYEKIKTLHFNKYISYIY